MGERCWMGVNKREEKEGEGVPRGNDEPKLESHGLDGRGKGKYRRGE